MDNQPEPLRIRGFDESDSGAILALHELALRGTGALREPGPWDEDLTRIDTTYIDAGGSFLVGETTAGIVAMGALRPVDDATAEIKRMRVHPDHQRRGYGTAILLELQVEAIQRGFRRLILDTTTKQEAARQLYLRHGFHEVERTERFGFEIICMGQLLVT